MPALDAALAATRRAGIAFMVTGGGSLAVDAHEGFAADLERDSTALRAWAADYPFNPTVRSIPTIFIGAQKSEPSIDLKERPSERADLV